MPEFSCADFSFPLLNRQQGLRLLEILEFKWVDIGLFERNPNFLLSELMDAPTRFTRNVMEDMETHELQPADVFLQIGKDPAELSANDYDPAVRLRNRVVFQRALEFCVALGCGHMTALPGVPHGCGERDFALAVEEATWRVEQCRQAGVIFAIEAHVGSICPNTTSARRLLSDVKDLTLTLDYGHFISLGEESTAVHALLPFASHMHVRGGARTRLQTSVAENTIDFEGMMTGLLDLHYKGKFALEYVWIDWESCNRTDNVSETILLRERLHAIATILNWRV